MIRLFRDELFSKPVIRRNFLMNWIDGSFFAFGMSFVPTVTVLPVFIRNIGGSNLAVSMLQVLWVIGFSVPQIFFSNYVRHLQFKKAFMLKTAFFQRLPWLLLAIISFFLIDHLTPGQGLLLFFTIFTGAAIASAVNFPGWFDLISKITPVTLRGRLFALRAVSGALLGILGGWSVRYILGKYPFPNNFGYLFLLASVMLSISYFALILLKEEEPNATVKPLNFKQYIKDLPGLLSSDKNFFNFLIADSFMLVGLIAQPFYILNAIHRFDLSSDMTGTFTIVLMGGMVLWNLISGSLGDRFGHKINLLTASFVIFINSILAIKARSIVCVYIIFVLDALVMSLIQVSRHSIVAEFSGEKERPTYIAVANMVTSPFILLGLVGGVLANRFGYNIVFLIAGLGGLFASVWWLFKIREPRVKISRINTVIRT